MFDLSYLKGTMVRDASPENQAVGHLLDLSNNRVRVGWELGFTSAVREEDLDIGEERCRHGIEVLTLDRGWIPFGDVLPVAPGPSGIISELRRITEDDHNPFQNKSRLGPGPLGSTLVKKNRWSCSGSGYQQTCVGVAPETKGRTIRVVIDPEKKRQYNKIYKRFLRNRRRRRRR